MKEGLKYDKKSLRVITGKSSNFPELARDCVAFANAKGGEIHIGIEDDSQLPPVGQKISEGLPAYVTKRINELTINVGIQANVEVASNGGQYLSLRIFPSVASVASTTTGIFAMRDNDSSRNLLPDELIRLMADKTAYCWETKVSQKVYWENCDNTKLNNFISDIRNSDRVSSFVKEKTSEELLLHYLMMNDEGFLTNLGILWIGTQQQRARVLYSPVVQYIKYDSEEQKVRKIMWDDYSLNPKELLEKIWKEVPDWGESVEISEGLWRKEIPVYDEKVVREVLCNCLVHRPYTTRGDIFINLYPDRMVVVNPGQLPYGVTPTNILQKSVKRNEHLAKVFYDLHLMEAEGSGYDLMYETLLSTGKRPPVIVEGNDSIEVTIERKIVSKEAYRLCDYVSQQYGIKQKGIIALGIIIQEGIINCTKLASLLQLSESERLRPYVTSLLENNIIVSSGRGKGLKYQVNPLLISGIHANFPTTLKTIEPYRLKALICEDLKFHANSLVSEVASRLKDVDYGQLQTTMRQMASQKELATSGGRKYRKYSLPEEFYLSSAGRKKKKDKKEKGS